LYRLKLVLSFVNVIIYFGEFHNFPGLLIFFMHIIDITQIRRALLIFLGG